MSDPTNDSSAATPPEKKLPCSGALLSIFYYRLRRGERFIGVRIDDKEDVSPALKQFFGQRGEL